MRSALRIAGGAALGLALLGESLPLRAQIRYIDGLFVGTTDGAIELIAYAEATSTGVLRMQNGSLEDTPVVHEVTRVLCSIPHWRPVGMLVASDAIFRDERAERRHIPFAGRKLNVYAIETRVSDLERRDKIESLLESVKASYNSPGYAFIVLTSGDYQRYYPIRLTPLEK